MKIYFLRHGVTANNTGYLFQGQIDTPLSREGIEQAEKEAVNVANDHLTFDRIYCSPLDRAIVTCEIVTGKDRSSFVFDKLLMEISYGPYEGKPIMESDSEMMAFLREPYKYDPPKGVESLQEVGKRMIEALDQIIGDNPDVNSILISSHGIALSTLFKKIIDDQQLGLSEKVMARHGKLYVSEYSKGKLSFPQLCFPDE